VARYSVSVHGDPTDEVLRRLSDTPGLQAIGTSAYWVGDKAADEKPPIQTITVVVEDAEDGEEAAQEVRSVLPRDAGYTVDAGEQLSE
jgi:hypothetical protein